VRDLTFYASRPSPSSIFFVCSVLDFLPIRPWPAPAIPFHSVVDLGFDTGRLANRLKCKPLLIWFCVEALSLPVSPSMRRPVSVKSWKHTPEMESSRIRLPKPPRQSRETENSE
jgi:hypothetical protein